MNGMHNTAGYQIVQVKPQVLIIASLIYINSCHSTGVLCSLSAVGYTIKMYQRISKSGLGCIPKDRFSNDAAHFY